ncbi:YjfB family protein [Salipaludibacillus sp. CF4.18]|uniref:YjfB family protein n=1 Tax=Salipaludibacillus sp. CF4.18 TaxID=3373081 RepID=UPI003F4BB8DC
MERRCYDRYCRTSDGDESRRSETAGIGFDDEESDGGQQSEALDKLIDSANVQKMEQATQPHLGGSIDVKK